MAKSIPKSWGERHFQLTEETERYRVAQVEAFILEHNLDSSVQLQLTTTCRGTKEGSPTLPSYHNCFENICAFSGLIGDYQTSCLFDRKLCPRNPYPAIPETIAMYYRWKAGKKGALLYDSNKLPVENATVNKVAGATYVKCTGEWNSPSGLEKARAAFSNLHMLYDNLRGVYQHSCPNCCHLNPKFSANNVDAGDVGIWKSCNRHASKPLLIPHGNAATAKVSVDAFNSIKAILESTHVVKGNVQLNPSQVWQLQQYLINSGDLYNQQTYTIMIVGIKLFLRAEEVLSMKMEDFEMIYAVIHDNSVRSLAVKIKGKSDSKPVLLKIWKDDENPEFCPVRILFCYLKATGIKSGYLFPSWFTLKAGIHDKGNHGHYCNHISYNDWLNRMKTVLCKTFPKDFNYDVGFCVGTHTLCKTAYLFAIWGVLRMWTSSDPGKPLSDITYAQILLSARHASVAHACLYVQDSFTLFDLVQEEQYQESQRVSPWKSILIVQTQAAIGIVAHSRINQQETVAKQADWYFQKEVVMANGFPFTRYYAMACRAKPNLNLQEQFDALIGHAMASKADRLEARRLNTLIIRDSARVASLGVSVDTMAGPSVAPVQISRKRIRAVSGGTDDLARHRASCGQLEVAGSSKKALFQELFEVHSIFTTRQSSLVDGARRWARNRSNTYCIMKDCIVNCFDGDAESYFSSLPTKLAITKHTCTCSDRK